MLSSAIIAQIVLRLYYVFHQQIDSDEPQHLHVIWGWTQGLVQYRDLFDNHAPLFHLLMAPFVGALGERAEIVLLARGLMLPLVAVTLWATYRLGRSLWSERVGLWAAALTGLVPTFLLTSIEFRADDLWMAAWMLTLVLLMGGALRPARAMAAGLLLGMTLMASLKTILLMLALGMAAAMVLALERPAERRLLPGRRWRAAAWIAGGFVVVPAGVMLAFQRLHALGAFFSCAVRHNIVPGLGLWRSAPHRVLIFPVAAVFLYLAAGRLLRPEAQGSLRRRQVVLLLTAAFFATLLESYWPLITKEDFLPLVPMAGLLTVATFRGGLGRVARAGARRVPAGAGMAMLALAVALGIVVTHRLERGPDDSIHRENQLLTEVLRFTRPGEPIMDLKGETIFRPRPYFYALEGVAKARLAMGLLPDRIAPDVVRARTHFAVADNVYFPPADREFLNRHFVRVGELRVLGADLAPGGAGDAERTFDVSYPERFGVIADGLPARGALDGRPYRAPVTLRPGPHRYRPAPGERRVAVLWEGALERKLMPASMLQDAR